MNDAAANPDFSSSLCSDSGPSPNPGPECEDGENAAIVDRRRAARYDCDVYAEVFLPSGGLNFRGRILNMSVTGCFVEAEFNLERGTRVEVYIETSSTRFRVAGAVSALRSKRGVGIFFVDLTRRGAGQIEELIGELQAGKSK
jgi:hypothetical protein